MAKFMVKANYKTKGVKGVMKEGGTGRRAVVKQLVESLGGKLESFYYAFGDVDAYIICDLPDASAAIALSLAVNASGAVNISLVPLITPEEIDAGSRKTVSYRAPGEDAPAKGGAKGKK
jgi:uncharacterized protein with GYD domain